MKTETVSAVSALCSPSLSAASRKSRTIGDLFGLACLISSLLLMSTGVQTVKADDDTLISVDPKLVEAARQNAAAKPVPESTKTAGDTKGKARAPGDYQRPGVPAIEVEPGVVVLNTRGFNYGPPPAAIDPAALAVEKDGPSSP